MKVLDTDFARNFIRLCNDGFVKGWHEANGGNVSYRLTREEVADVKSNFNAKQWVHLDVALPDLAGECFLITASGSMFRSITHEPKRMLGVIEIDLTGTSWRECWGFKDGGAPTSELVLHLLAHQARKVATDLENRVIYHAHPENIIALTCVLPPQASGYFRLLSSHLTEMHIVFPQGIGVVPWHLPGSSELALSVADCMKVDSVVLVPQHGVFVSGNSLDEAFGRLETLEKASSIVLKTRAAGGPNIQPHPVEPVVRLDEESSMQASILPCDSQQQAVNGGAAQASSSPENVSQTQPLIPKIETNMPELSVDEVLQNFPGAIEGAGFTPMPQVVSVEEQANVAYAEQPIAAEGVVMQGYQAPTGYGQAPYQGQAANAQELQAQPEYHFYPKGIAQQAQ